MTLLFSDAPKARAARDRVHAIVSRAAGMALDESVPADLRLASIGLMGHTDHALAGNTLESLLAPRHASDLQIAAVGALFQLPEREAAAILVEPRRWATYTPQVREAVLSGLMAEERHITVLLDALEQKAFAPAGLGAARRNRLVNHRNSAIQARARVLLATVDAGDRMQVYERLRAAVAKRSGQPGNGKRVFAGQCAACHTFDNAGGRLGPDLSGVRNQPADALLLHTLVPEYEITPGYETYVVETRDGRTLFGRLESEAPNSVTLRDAASQQHVIVRGHVASMSASPTSLMPNELERAMSEQELADLIAYLKNRD